jgi:hypothetical protein
MKKVRKMTDELNGLKGACEGCKGCSVRSGCHENYKSGNLRVYYKNRMDKCPCKTCLIKMICNKTCQDYEIAWDIEGLNIR